MAGVVAAVEGSERGGVWKWRSQYLPPTVRQFNKKYWFVKAVLKKKNI
jgi:hypothetical protein